MERKKKRNWELSALRSVAIINEMRKRKNRDGLPMIDGKFLHGRAMGEFHPAELKDGSSKWNRRVEIVIQGRGPAAQKAAFKVEKILWGNIMADENEVEEEKKSSIVR